MIQEGSYSELSARIHARGTKERLPLAGVMELTHRCPLTCQHCYNNLPAGDRNALARELTLPEYDRILGELADAGCLWMLFTGGEIFARPDFMDIYAAAKRRGIIVTLFTNGTMITPEIADQLRAMPPFIVEITLYGATRETYERLTRIPGSYDRCIRGIELLRERKIPLKLKTAVTSINHHEVYAMKSWAHDRGLDFKFDALMNPRTDCSQSPLEVRLRPEDVVALDMHDPARVTELARFTQAYMNRDKTPKGPAKLYQCGGGATSFAIDPYGRLSICILSQVDMFDLRTGSFKEGWDGFLHKVRAKTVTRPTKCNDCDLKAICGMCPANGELENRDAEAPVDWLCQLAHLRARSFGLEVPAHGACEYCAGGAKHEQLEALAAGLRKGAPPLPEMPVPRRGALRMAQGAAETGCGCGSGGCGAPLE